MPTYADVLRDIARRMDESKNWSEDVKVFRKELYDLSVHLGVLDAIIQDPKPEPLATLEGRL